MNVQKFNAKLQEKRKLKNKLKQKHFQIIEDKGFDVEE